MYLLLPKRKKSRKKRGYPVAVLIGFDSKAAILWQIFSEIVKPFEKISLTKPSTKLAENELYNFFEEIIDKIRPTIKEGLRSVILVNPKDSSLSERFQKHILKHHKWLSQEASSNFLMIGTIVGRASNQDDIAELIQTEAYQDIVAEITTKEAGNIIDVLEEQLNKVAQGEVVLYSLQDIETLTYGQWKYGKRQPEYVLLTNEFLRKHKQKQRLYRLLQILENKKVKTKIVDAETAAGERITQFGGLICFTKIIDNQ